MMKKLLFIVGIMFFVPAVGMQMPQPAVNIQLRQAVIDGNLPMVRLMLEQGADPNKSTAYGEPVLKFAVINRQNVDIVKALLDAGADPSLTPQLLCDCLKSPILGMARDKIRDMIIQHPKTNLNCIGRFERSELTPFMFAVRNSDGDLMNKLLQTGRVDINVRNAERKRALDFAKAKQMRQWLIMQGAQSGSEFAGRRVPAAAAGSMGAAPAAAQPKASKKRKEAAHMKAFTGEFKVSRQEIPVAAPPPIPAASLPITQVPVIGKEAAQNLNQQLVQAVIKEDAVGVRSLLAQGADPNAHVPAEVISREVFSRSTVYNPIKLGGILDFAVLAKQNADIVKVLLNAGADPNPGLLCDLLNAAFSRETRGRGYIQIRDMLIQHPKTNLNCLVRVGVQRKIELTPLMFAVRSDDDYLVDTLLKTNRIDINVRNSEGKTALDFAKHQVMRGKLLSSKMLTAPVVPIPAAAQPQIHYAAPGEVAPFLIPVQPAVGQKRKEVEPTQLMVPAAQLPQMSVQQPAEIPAAAQPTIPAALLPQMPYTGESTEEEEG